MKKITTIFIAMALCVGITGGVFGQNKGSAVYLNVQIDDLVSQGVYGIGSDHNGTYSNGLSSVSAQFTQYGFLDFNSGTRFINAYYSTPIEMTSNALPSSDSQSGVTIKTHGGSNYLQNMTVGEVRCVQTSVNWIVGAYNRSIGYNASYGDISKTGKVKVTHSDANTWVMESDSAGACISPDGLSHENTARIRDHRTSGKPIPDIDYGRWFMPMRVVLTRK